MPEIADLPVVPPWFETVAGDLQAALVSDRLPHALLLHGAPGSGRNELARALARNMLCRESSPAGACGLCRSCSLGPPESHPDFLALEPEGKGRRIPIDAVRGLLEFTAQTPAMAARQVVVLRDAERMSAAAANALLKRLEEPAGATVFLLVAGRREGLAATVRSRCRQLRLGPPDAAEAERWLRRQGLPEEAERLLESHPRQPFRVLELLRDEQASAAVELRTAMRSALEPQPGAVAPDWPRLLGALPPGEGLLCLRDALEARLRSGALGAGGFLVLEQVYAAMGSAERGATINEALLLRVLLGRVRTRDVAVAGGRC